MTLSKQSSLISDADLSSLRELAEAEIRTKENRNSRFSEGFAFRENVIKVLNIAVFLGEFDPNLLLSALTREDLEVLLSTCSVTAKDGKSQWKVLPEARKAVFRMLVNNHALRDTARYVETHVKSIVDDPVASASINWVLNGQPDFTALLKMNRMERAAYRTVRLWFLDLPDADLLQAGDIQADIELAELLDPFLFLTGFDPETGEDNFIGRGPELTYLRSFTDVLKAKTTYEGLKRGLSRIVSSSQDSRELFLWGTGGMGKSTLVAKFLLQHFSRDKPPLLFAYIDFDRASISATQPATILIEMLRQLSWQLPNYRHRFEGLRKRLSEALNQEKRLRNVTVHSSESKELPVDLLVPSIRDFCLENLGEILDAEVKQPVPLLLILDTFEEAQLLGDECVIRIERFVEAVREIIKPFRLLLVGRDEANGFFSNATRRELEEYDIESRQAFLQKNGLGPDVAHTLARMVGGKPLALLLASRLAVAQGFDAAQLTYSERIRSMIDSTLIVGILYERTLKHIKDDYVREIAQKGLALRRIDRELIQHVLAPIFGWKTDESLLNNIIGALSKQRDLVSIVQPGVFVHRSDIRQQMLKLITKDDPIVIQEIHSRAERYYAVLESSCSVESEKIDARIERIYHLLQNDQGINSGLAGLWIPEGIQLANSLEEFHRPSSKAALKVLLGHSLTIEEVDILPVSLLDRYLKNLATLALEDYNIDGCISIFERHKERVVSATVQMLYFKLLDRGGRWRDASSLLESNSLERQLDPGRSVDLDFYSHCFDLLSFCERSQFFPLGLISLQREILNGVHSSTDINLKHKTAVALLRYCLAQGDGSTGILQQALSLLDSMNFPDNLSMSRVEVGWIVHLLHHFKRSGDIRRMPALLNMDLRPLSSLERIAESGPDEAIQLIRDIKSAVNTYQFRGFENAIQRHASKDDIALILLRHVTRPPTPEWYVPLALMLIHENAAISTLAKCAETWLPGQAVYNIRSPFDLVELLSELDRYGVIQIPLRSILHLTSRTHSARLIGLYLRWRTIFFSDLDSVFSADT